MSTTTTPDFYANSLQALERDLYGPLRFPLTVQLGAQSYQFGIWAGEQLPDPLLAFDTETELIVERQIPRLALATVYGSQGSGYLIHPDRLGAFIRQHSQAAYCAHNACFDFWVVAEHLRSDQAALAAWWQIAGQGRLCCTMLLDALLRLADIDAEPINRALDVVALEYAGLTIDKEDPFRLRYAELLGQTVEQWADQPAGFFEYAAKDPIATLLVFQQQIARARPLIAPHKQQLLPDAWSKYGPLTACLQTQGAIALDAISRAGVSVDVSQAQTLHDETGALVQQHLAELEQLGGLDLFKRYKKGARAGHFMLSKSGAPKRNAKAIKQRLQQIAQQHAIKPPRLKDGSISDAPSYWLQHAEQDPFLQAYCQFHERAGLLKFFKELKQERIHPRYIPLVRTGRTSCRKPNLQQLPRDSRFREMIVAPAGSWLLQIDYSVLELRVLAQICLQRYGRSRLAELFQQGQDPHRYTAALLLGLTPGQFAQLPKDQQKQHRQKSKCVNFGVPGGLGPASLVSYAKSSYNVTLTFDEAKELRRRLCEEIYPELSAYLQDQPYQQLAANLQTSEALARQAFGQRRRIDAAFRIVAGETAAAAGDEYSAELIQHVWLCLRQLNANSALAEQIRGQQPSLELARRIFWGPAVTISGRLRGHVGFTQRANSPFQSLAADGAKLALFRLLQAGFRVVGFIHDEMLIELPDGADYDAAVAAVQQILAESMEELTPSIPIATEFLLADRWYKDAPEQPRSSAGRIAPYRREQPGAVCIRTATCDIGDTDQPAAVCSSAATCDISDIAPQPQANAGAELPAALQAQVKSEQPAPPAAGPTTKQKRNRSIPGSLSSNPALAVFVDPLQLGLPDPVEVKPQTAPAVEVKHLTSSPARDPQPARPAAKQLTQPTVELQPIPGFAKYAASRDGRIWSARQCKANATPGWRELRPDRRPQDQRKRFTLRSDTGEYIRRYGAHWVLLAFVGPCPDGLEGCHKNGNCTDDSADNLRWDTPTANKADMLLHGTRLQGETATCAKLTDEQARQIGQRSAAGESQTALAAEYGITVQAVSYIRAGKRKQALTQPIKYFGGKFYLAQRILELMPPHLHYVEPYAGGLAVLLARDPDNCSEVVNDLNGQLTNFWRCLQDPQRFEQFSRMVAAIPLSQIEFQHAQADADPDPVAAAVAFFVLMRQSRQGLGKDFATLSRNRTRRGMNEQASSWLSAVDGLPDIHQRLRSVVILCQDAIKTIQQQDGLQTLFYCDPPYQHSTRSSTGEYTHEMTDQQHQTLLEVLARIQGKFILSGYHSPLYDSWAKQHNFRCIEIEIDNKASSAKQKQIKTECLWLNY